ncbi:MAG: hypothetical protein GY749_41750 [Desulfobacteraceae bacterium]|nr:hypothetical protein [Desulfobacteraceae bacterium]
MLNFGYTQKGWWYFEDYLTRTLVDSASLGVTWNIAEGTNDGRDNVMSQSCMPEKKYTGLYIFQTENGSA